MLEPGFWILTKGVKRQPVQGQPRPNSTQVSGMEQHNFQSNQWSEVRGQRLRLVGDNREVKLGSAVSDQPFQIVQDERLNSKHESFNFKG